MRRAVQKALVSRTFQIVTTHHIYAPLRAGCRYFGSTSPDTTTPPPSTSKLESLSVLMLNRTTGELSKKTFLRADVLKAFPGVFARDLRTISDATPRMISEVLLREGSFFLKLESIRVLVGRDMILVFEADAPLSIQYAERLRDEAMRVKSSSWVEVSALETALIVAQENFEQRFALLDPLVRRLLRSLVSYSDEEASMRLIPVKHSISKLHTALQEYRKALHAISTPERLQGLQLSGRADPITARMLEVMINDFGTRAEEIVNELDDLSEQLSSVEMTITQSLSSTRNNLMRLNIKISMCALGVSVAGAGFSAFGMNMVSGLEERIGAFEVVGVGVLAMSIAAYSVMNAFYRRSDSRFLRLAESTSLSFFSSINNPSYVHELFARKDLTSTEMMRVLQSALGKDVSLSEVDEIKAVADKNHDKFVTLGELISWMAEHNDQAVFVEKLRERETRNDL